MYDGGVVCMWWCDILCNVWCGGVIWCVWCGGVCYDGVVVYGVV